MAINGASQPRHCAHEPARDADRRLATDDTGAETSAELDEGPVVATHSGLKGIVDSPRNLSDEELELTQKNGGVVQGVAFGNYLRKAPAAADEQAPAVPATVAQLIESITYAVKKIGIDHVGISSDFNHGGGVNGWQNEGEALNVTVELLRRGYSERDIAKLWGGNFLRAWSGAQKLGKIK
jgi:membrane dipeptidase